MSQTEYPTPEQTAMFIQTQYGAKPQFRGFHGIPGDVTKNDGAYTPIYAYLAGRSIRIGTQKANPEPVTFSIDAYLPAIGDLVSAPRDCPLDIVLLLDKCLSPEQKMSWGRWGSTDPQIFLLFGEAFIETRTLSNLASREGNQSQAMGGVQVKNDGWVMIKGNQNVSLTTVVAATTVVSVMTTQCSGCADANCGGDTACSVWYAAAANGEVWKSTDGGSTWTEASPSSAWTAGTCIYADQLIVLAGGNDGVAGDYGVKRSTDGGANWTEVLFETAAALKTGAVNQIVRYQEDLFAFTALGIWRSVNDGLSWTQVDATEGFLASATDGAGFCMAVTATKLYYSTDGGLHWSELTTDPGGALKDVAITGGYAHVVDSAAGYSRCPVSLIKQNDAAWEVMDTTTGITDILFCSRVLGYRLRGTAIDMTINGGYSWKEVNVAGAAPTFAQMFSCGGRLGIAGGVYFGYFTPFYDTANYTVGSNGCGC